LNNLEGLVKCRPVSGRSHYLLTAVCMVSH